MTGRMDPRPPDGRPEVRVSPTHRAMPGRPAQVEVEVVNRAERSLSIRVGVVGVESGWISRAIIVGPLEPEASAKATLVLEPPPGTLAARYPFAVVAEPLDPGTGSAAEVPEAVAEAMLVVGARPRTVVAIEPSRISGVARRRVHVTIRNDDVRDVEVRLDAPGHPDLTVSLRRRRVTVPAGGEARVGAAIRTRRPRILGPGSGRSGYVVTATTDDTVETIRGSFEQRSLIGPGLRRAIALATVVAVWIAAGYVLIPEIAGRLRPSPGSDAVVASPGTPSATPGSSKPPDVPIAPGTAPDPGGTDGGAVADGAGTTGAGANRVDPATGDPRLQLTGTVSGTERTGVIVSIQSQSIVDEATLAAATRRDAAAQPAPVAMIDPSAMAPTAYEDARVRPRSSTLDRQGSWRFANLPRRGYFVLTVAKRGFQTQRLVVDASSDTATDPLDVTLTPGRGTLEGRVAGGGGASQGGALITVTDGSTTLEARSGADGRWHIDGLSVPSRYVVTAVRGTASASRAVELAPDRARGAVDLRLRDGVEAVTGVVTADPTFDGPLPAGTTVTLSNGAFTRTTTVIGGGEGGSAAFLFTDVPWPGDYTLTATAEGLQTTSVPVPRVPRDLTISMASATSTLRGTVAVEGVDRTAAPPTLGVTLAQGDRIYKVTTTPHTAPRRGASTSSDAAADFVFPRVAPGSYLLSTEYFGHDPLVRRVELVAGTSPTPLSLRLETSSSTSSTTLVGTAVDATTGGPVSTCGTVDVGSAPDILPLTARATCLRATLVRSLTTDADAVAPGGAAAPCSAGPVDVDPALPYRLSRCDAGREGLDPGAYQVRLEAPGYRSQLLTVEVGQDRPEVALPRAELQPLPVVSGRVSVSADVPSPPPASNRITACVVLSRSATAPLPDCARASALGRDLLDDVGRGADPETVDRRGVCLPGAWPGRAAAASAEGTMCVAVEVPATGGDVTNGGFSIQTPTDGSYVMRVITSAEPSVSSVHPIVSGTDYTVDGSDLIFTGPSEVRAQFGVTQSLEVPLDRLAQADLVVEEPVSSASEDILTPTSGATVVVRGADGRVVPGVGVTRETDLYRLRGLPAGPLRIEATTPGTPTRPGHAGSLEVTVGGTNQTLDLRTDAERRLRLIDPIGPFGATIVDPDLHPIAGADVTLDGAVRLPVAPGSNQVTRLRSSNRGCIAVQPGSVRPEKNERCGDLERSGGDGSGTDAAQTVGSLGLRPYVTTTMRRVVVTAAGFDPYDRTGVRLTQNPGPYIAAAAPLVLLPALARVSLPVTLSPAPSGSDPRTIAVSVTGPSGSLGSDVPPRDVSASVTVGADGPEIRWIDRAARYLGRSDDANNPPQPAPAVGRAVPGRYAITLSSAGYADLRTTLDCPAGGTCVPRDTLTLRKPADVKVRVVSEGSARTPIRGARVVATTESGVVPEQLSGPDGQVAGYAGLSTYAVDGAVRGVRLSLQAEAPGFEDASTAATPAALTCEGGTVTVTGSVIAAPDGSVVRCTLTLRPLQTIEGTVASAVGTRTVPSAGLLVRATCTSCSAADAGSRSYVTRTDADGRYRFFGSLQPAGASSATYSIIAVRDGFEQLPAPLSVTLDPSDGQWPIYQRDLTLMAVPTKGVIRLQDESGRPVESATVELTDPQDPGSSLLGRPTEIRGRYAFDRVAPQDWIVRVSGAGLQTITTYAVRLSPTERGPFDLTVVVPRQRAQVSGVVAVAPGQVGAGDRIAAARLVLRCVGATGSGSTCGDQQQAFDIDGEPASTSADARGRFTLQRVPPGAYVLETSAKGYLPGALPIIVGTDDQQVDVVLRPVTRQISFTVRVDGSRDGVDGATLVLTPTPGTPGRSLTTVVAGSTAQLTDVRWGCYQVGLRLPSGHLGDVGPPGGPVADPGCGVDGVRVPTDVDSQPLPVSLAVTETPVRLKFTALAYPGHPVPAAASVEFRRGRSQAGAPVGTVTVTDGSEVWLPPGEFALAATLVDVPAGWWEVTAPPISVPSPGDPPRAVMIDLQARELTAAVVVRLPGLVSGEEGVVGVSAGPGQSAVLPDAVRSTKSGVVEIELPYGRWTIEGDGPRGPTLASLLLDKDRPRPASAVEVSPRPYSDPQVSP